MWPSSGNLTKLVSAMVRQATPEEKSALRERADSLIKKAEAWAQNQN